MYFRINRALLVIGIISASLSLSGIGLAIAWADNNPNVQGSTDWRTDNWTNQDGSYIQIRSQLESLLSTKKLTTELINTYYSDYAADPKNPIRAFRWQYACFLADRAIPPINVGMSGSDLAFDTAKDPNTYDYSRLRFLQSSPHSIDDEVIDVGKKLLARDPNDYHVEASLIFDLRPWLSIARKNEAIAYARDLVSRRPNDPNAKRMMGIDVYYVCWTQMKDKYDADRAIAWCRRYVSTALPVDKNKEYAMQYIKEISDEMAIKLHRPNYSGDTVIDPLLK